ncbi:MAG: hypothetical protein ACYDC3_16005 [Candidatus Binataceae bacterium]
MAELFSLMLNPISCDPVRMEPKRHNHDYESFVKREETAPPAPMAIALSQMAKTP